MEWCGEAKDLAALAKGQPDESPEFQAESTYLSAISLAETGELQKAVKLLKDTLQASPKIPQADAMLLYLAKGNQTSRNWQPSGASIPQTWKAG